MSSTTCESSSSFSKQNELLTTLRDPDTDASPTIHGFTYQIEHTINEWADLKEDEVIYIERVEDFERISATEISASQVKGMEKGANLNQSTVLKSLLNCTDYLKKVDEKFIMLYVTNQRATKERPYSGEFANGITEWNECHRLLRDDVSVGSDCDPLTEMQHKCLSSLQTNLNRCLLDTSTDAPAHLKKRDDMTDQKVNRLYEWINHGDTRQLRRLVFAYRFVMNSPSSTQIEKMVVNKILKTHKVKNEYRTFLFPVLFSYVARKVIGTHSSKQDFLERKLTKAMLTDQLKTMCQSTPKQISEEVDRDSIIIERDKNSKLIPHAQSIGRALVNIQTEASAKFHLGSGLNQLKKFAIKK